MAVMAMKRNLTERARIKAFESIFTKFDHNQNGKICSIIISINIWHNKFKAWKQNCPLTIFNNETKCVHIVFICTYCVHMYILCSYVHIVYICTYCVHMYILSTYTWNPGYTICIQCGPCSTILDHVTGKERKEG